MALILFIGTLTTSVIVLLSYENGEDDIKAAVSCIVMLVSFIGIGSSSFKIFMVFFMKKIVTPMAVKHIDKSLEFSAFRNMHDIEPESDHKLTPL
jgi:hypothetical protein